MSSGRRIGLVVAVVVLVSVLPQGTPPVLAFTEGASSNFFGTGAGANTTGPGNSFFGGDAGNANTVGDNNSFFGKDAGLSNTTGFDNSFFGKDAGRSNTTGFFNAFFGKDAGLRNTTGFDNAFFGRRAGDSNSTGPRNAFFGSSAGAANSTGSDNAFFGYVAGLSNSTGINNAFFGQNAGRSNTTGIFNTFVGSSSGAANTNGSHNSFLGLNAGDSNTTGFENTLIGVSAGHNNTTGAKNVIVGSVAGSSNTTESGNTFLGAVATGGAGITNATALGLQAQVLQSNSLVLGSIAGLNGAINSVDVGIGTAAPKQALHLTRNGVSRFRIENSDNGAVWDFQSSGGSGSFVIDRVGGPSTLDFELRPTGELVLNNTVTATDFITSSDRAKKTDITSADASKLMALLRDLDISTWRFKTEPEGTVNLGPMAQDFHRLFGMGTETTIDVRDLAALALVAVQAQQQEIDELKARSR